MNVWIDLGHIPQYNFYRPVIDVLIKEKHQVFVTYRKRGRMAKILHAELGGKESIHLFEIGTQRASRWSVIFEANLLRLFQLFYWKLGKKVDVILANGYQAAMVGWFFGIPSYSFDDDPQTFDYKPKLWFNKKTHYCIYKRSGMKELSPKAIILPVLKEWSYLAPSSFHPDISVLEPYGVSPKEYVFLREVSVDTMNYIGQQAGSILNIADLIPKNLKVLFSLEQKNKRDLYPKDWILLQEPLKDVHSLIYYSRGLMSSGDSMAREAAMLGVPSYYLGVRYSMPANETAHEVAGLQNEKTMPVSQWIQQLNLSEEKLKERQDLLRKQIGEKFIDIKQYILNTIGL